MSDRLGVGQCWVVFVMGPTGAPAQEHHPASSAEVGDSGALIIRVERLDPKTEGEKNRYEVSRAYSPMAWRAVLACHEAHSSSPASPEPGSWPGTRPPVEVLQGKPIKGERGPDGRLRPVGR